MAFNTDEMSRLAQKYNNKKTILAVISLLLVVGLGVLSAIPEFMLSPEKIRTAKFWTNTIVNIIMGLTSFICLMLIGQTSNSANKISQIYKARNVFRELAEDITKNHYNAFRQWLNKVFHPSQQKEKNIALLHSVGISNLKYLDLDIEEIKNLETTPTKELKKLTKEQIKALVDIKTGKTAIRFTDCNAYLSESKSLTYQVPAERIANQYRTTVASVGATVLSRLILMVGIAVAFGLIGWSTIQDISDGERVATIVWNILARLFTTFTNAFMGYFDGGRFNDRDADFLNEKVAIIYRFKDDKSFKPLTEEEEAKEEFIAFVKEKEKENSKQLGIWNGDGKQEVAVITQK